MYLMLKAFALSLIGATAASAAIAISASAETGGHFTTGSVDYAKITGTESGTHTTRLLLPGFEEIKCTEASYSGQIFANEALENVTLTPSYGKCEVEGEEEGTTIDMNGCDYVFRVGKKASNDNTVDLVCPAGKAVFITHVLCTITIPPATNTKGIAYETVVEAGVHALTANVTVTGIKIQYHAGLCAFIGTNHTATLSGSVTVKATTNGEQIDITATGSED